jgi:hypothetical protein
MTIWKRSTGTTVAAVLVPRAIRRCLASRLWRPGTASSSRARRPAVPVQHQPASAPHRATAVAQHRATVPVQHRATRRYQALLDLPAPADGRTPEGVPWPTWRAVVRARHHQTNGGGLFSALVSGPEDEAPADSRVVVTMVVVGDSPADYLGIGDEFDLWRGVDVAHGVITRRLFV